MSRSSRSQAYAVCIFLILTAVNVCLVACASRGQTPVTESPRALNIRTVLVVPFNSATERYEIGATVRCSMCGAVFVAGPVTPGSEKYMTQQIMTFLKAKTTYTLIPPGEGEGARSKILSESIRLSDRDLLLEMGRKLKADAVLSGTIYRFRQRVGTGFSVDTPASVAFDLHLVRVADGHLIWVGHSDETQQPLSDNLFKLSRFVEGGGAWLTAEELARFGLNRSMATFPIP
ncbi:MAG: hypothetical protein ABUK14_05555 [Desulfobacteria bacterium]